MGRKILAVVIGLVVGFVSLGGVEAISSVVYPPPADLDLRDRQALGSHIQGLPAGAFALVLAAHALGSFAGGLVCALVAKQAWYRGAMIVGCVMLVAGIANLAMIPHPQWFATVDVLLYLPSALLGCAAAGVIVKNRDVAAVATS